MELIMLAENVCFKGYTLIIPGVATDNVAYSACNLLKDKLGPQKIGAIRYNVTVPLQGRDTAEIFLAQDYKCVIIQFLHTIGEDVNENFSIQLMDWVKASDICQVIILTGIFDPSRGDSEIAGPPVKYIMSPNFKELSNLFPRSGEVHSLFRDMPGDFTVHDMATETGPISLQGGGISLPLFSACVGKDIPAIMIVRYCTEENNVDDPVVLCVHINKWFHFVPENSSW